MTAEDILNEQSLDVLKEQFYTQCEYCHLYPALFDLISKNKLRRFLCEQFKKRYSVKQLARIFGYDNNQKH